MQNTAVRIFLSALLIVLIYLGSVGVRASLKTPTVAPPRQDIDKLPLQFGDWQGKQVDLDPKVFIATGATKAIDREYRNVDGSVVLLHCAVFSDPAVGIYHNPMNCYRAAGWQNTSSEFAPVDVPGRPSIPVRFTKWKREEQRAMVAYWYRFGEHTLFTRWDLPKVRWQMRGKKVWPSMVKVLLQTNAANEEKAAANLQSIAKYIYGWLSESADRPKEENPARS